MSRPDDLGFEILSLKKLLGNIVAEKLKIGLESFLDPEISGKYFRLAIERLKRDLGLNNNYTGVSIGSIDSIISLHILLIILNMIQDHSLRERIIDREIEYMRRTLERNSDLNREILLREIAPDLGLQINHVKTDEHSQSRQRIIYISFSERKDRLKPTTRLYSFEMRVLDFIKIISTLKIVDKYDLKKIPVKNGYIYLPSIDLRGGISLSELILDIARYRMKELLRIYEELRELPQVKAYESEISKIVDLAKREATDLYTRNIIRIIESLNKAPASRRSLDIIPECIKTLIEKTHRNEELNDVEVYLLASFLAYTGLDLEIIRSLISEKHGYLMSIITRIRDLRSRNIYYIPPSCNYIRKIMGIKDDSCTYRNPLQAYRRMIIAGKT
ncbi:MAG: hypothetical protein QXJ51_00725 [Sulfolobales archaeon]